MLIEIDLQNNPIDNSRQIINAILNKKEILIFNLRKTPVALKTRTTDDLYLNDPDRE